MPTAAPPKPAQQKNIGRVTPGHRLDVRRRVSRESTAAHLQRGHGQSRAKRHQAPSHRRGAAASRRRPGPLRGPGQHRRHGPRHAVPRYGSPVTVPVGKATLGRVFNLIGEPIDGLGPVKADDYWPIHRDSPAGHRPLDRNRSLRDRHQGDRPLNALCPRRQGRAFRRGRPGQDRDVDRTYRPHRHRARRFLSVRRSWRADPRRQRPVAGNATCQNWRHRPKCDRRRPAWSSGR